MKQIFSIFMISLLIFSCKREPEVHTTNNNIPKKQHFCYDILSAVAQKPVHSSLYSYSFYRNSSVIYSAKYIISGAHTTETENFMITRYGMGPLFFVCCGWETKNKPGYIRSANYESDFSIIELDMLS